MHETIHWECVETEKVRIKHALPTLPASNTNKYASVVGRTTYMVLKERKIKVEIHSLKDI